MVNTKYEPADIEIYLKNQGLVRKEKSLIAYQESDGKILAVGTEAEQIAKQQQNGVVVVSPLRQGMIADYARRYKCLECCLSALVENGIYGNQILWLECPWRKLQRWKKGSCKT